MSEKRLCPKHIPTNIVPPTLRASLDGYAKLSSESRGESVVEDIKKLSKLHGVEHMNITLLHAMINQFRIHADDNQNVWGGNMSIHFIKSLIDNSSVWEEVAKTITDFERKKFNNEYGENEATLGRLINGYRYLKAINANFAESSTHAYEETSDSPSTSSDSELEEESDSEEYNPDDIDLI